MPGFAPARHAARSRCVHIHMWLCRAAGEQMIATGLAKVAQERNNDGVHDHRAWVRASVCSCGFASLWRGWPRGKRNIANRPGVELSPPGR